MGKVIWNKNTGEAREYESVDAREILAASPDIYTDIDPKDANPKDPDVDGKEGAPQNVANVAAAKSDAPKVDTKPEASATAKK